MHARFPWIPPRAYAQSVQLIRRDGRTWQGAAAIEEIIDQLPKGKLITWIFSIPLVRPLAERFYRWFARNRYRLGCGEHCQFRRRIWSTTEGVNRRQVGWSRTSLSLSASRVASRFSMYDAVPLR